MRALVAKSVAVALCLSFLAAGSVGADDPAPADASKKAADYEKYLEQLRRDAEIRWEDKVRLAEHYLSTGKARFEERMYEQAENDFEKALAANPNLTEAKGYLQKTRRILGKTVAGESDLIVTEGLDTSVRGGYQRAVMLQAIAEARQLLRDKNYDAALSKLEEAQNIAKVLATRINVSREAGEIGQLIEQASAESKKSAKDAEERKREQAGQEAKAEHARLAELQSQRIQRLFDDARQLYAEGRYLLAAKKAEEILKIEPRNKEAIAFRDKANEVQAAEDLKQYAKDKARETANTWRETRRQAIPYAGVQPLYPDDWEEKKTRTYIIPLETGAEEDPAWKKDLEAKLEKEISFEFIATPLDDVVAFLRTYTKANIVLDRQQLAGQANLDVTLRLDQVKFKDGLAWILKLLNLSYTLEGEAIFISTKEKIGQTKRTVTRFYDVTDLTLEIKNFKPDVRAISNADMGNDGGGGGNWTDPFSEDTSPLDRKPDTFTGESLVEFIKTVIAPGTWEDVAPAKDFAF